MAYDAGWSSQVARKAHNLEVAGSNPAPATKLVQPAGLRQPAFVLNTPVLCISVPSVNFFETTTQQRRIILLARRIYGHLCYDRHQ